MLSEYINNILENNILLSGVVAIICTLLFYIENRRSDHKYENMSYLKLVILISVSIFFVLYVKNKKIPVPDVNVKIGEPNF